MGSCLHMLKEMAFSESPKVIYPMINIQSPYRYIMLIFMSNIGDICKWELEENRGI